MGQRGTDTGYRQSLGYSSEILLTYNPWRPCTSGENQRHNPTDPCSTSPIISRVPQRIEFKMSSKIALRIGNLIRQIQVAKLHWRQRDLYKARFCNGKRNTGSEKSYMLNKAVFWVNLSTSRGFVLKAVSPLPENKIKTELKSVSAKIVTCM